MASKRIIDSSKNIAKSFVPMAKELEEIANERNKPIIEIYDMFLSDLQNYFNQGYNNKIEEIGLNGFSRETINRLYTHISKLKKNLQEKEKKEKQRQEKTRQDEAKIQEIEAKWLEIEKSIDESVLKGKQGTKREILEKLISDINQKNSIYKLDSKSRKYIGKKLKVMLDDIDKKEKNRAKQQQEEKRQRDEQTKRVKTIMKEIEDIVEREYSKGKVKNRGNYLMAIKNTIIGENQGRDLSINIDESEQEQLLQMLDERIKTEKDEMYFEQVRSFTDDFRFLRSYSETANAMYGAKKRKFTDMESYYRYSDLREKLLKSNNEYVQISKLLASGKIEDADKRILLARKEYMDKEIENSKKIGEVR